MTRLTEPTGYSYQDITSPRLRVYYPSRSAGSPGAPPIVPPVGSPYPVVLFAHGQRSDVDALCPTDLENDYTRWDTILPLLARCGFVVVSPDLHLSIFRPADAAAAVLQAHRWVRREWVHQAIVRQPDVIIEPGQPAPLPKVGVIGHSWGALVGARLAAERRVGCLATVNGTWDDTNDLDAARVPTFLIGGTADEGISSEPRRQPFCGRPAPAHQATLYNIGHWDVSELRSCSDDSPKPPQARGSRIIAAEMLTVFMHRYLYKDSRLSPTLIGPAGGRPALTPHLDPQKGTCAVQIRYRDPFTNGGDLRTARFGQWPSDVVPWADCDLG